MIFLLIDIENIFARPRKTLKDDKWGLIYLAKWTTHFLGNRFSTVFNNNSLRSRHTLVGLISENVKIWWSLVRPHTKIYWVIVSLGTYQWAAILVFDSVRRWMWPNIPCIKNEMILKIIFWGYCVHSWRSDGQTNSTVHDRKAYENNVCKHGNNLYFCAKNVDKAFPSTTNVAIT